MDFLQPIRLVTGRQLYDSQRHHEDGHEETDLFTRKVYARVGGHMVVHVYRNGRSIETRRYDSDGLLFQRTVRSNGLAWPFEETFEYQPHGSLFGTRV